MTSSGLANRGIRTGNLVDAQCKKGGRRGGGGTVADAGPKVLSKESKRSSRQKQRVGKSLGRKGQNGGKRN